MPDGKATTTRSTFRVAYAVWASIDAPAETIWDLLIDVSAQRRWNSTLTSIEGEVAPGKRVTFVIPEAPGQKFSPTVTSFVPPRSMVWRLNRWPLLTSERTYRLTPQPGGSTQFTIAEVFTGLLLPVAGRTFPDFGRMFERTAVDLEAAARNAIA